MAIDKIIQVIIAPENSFCEGDPIEILGLSESGDLYCLASGEWEYMDIHSPEIE